MGICMKMSEIKKLSRQDIEKTLGEKKASLRNFRFGVAGSKVRNMKEGKNLKRDIARLLTERSARTKET